MCKLILNLYNGLKHIHETLKISHRDISPRNVLIDKTHSYNFVNIGAGKRMVIKK